MPLVVILGMHRSGTSFLCRSLHEAGMYLGNDVEILPHRNNLDGHWESVEAVAINKRLLALSGGAWDSIPPTIHADEPTAAQMASFVNGLNGHGTAGWKDPRTTVTWPCWKPHLPPGYRIVATLRHPAAVARSLQRRNDWPLERALSLWADYNARLLEIVTVERDVLWFNFDASPVVLAASIDNICQSLGLPRSPAAKLSFNPYLRHDAEEHPLPEHVSQLYQQLLDLALSAGSSQPGAVAAAITPADLHLSLEHLSRIVSAQSEVLQRDLQCLNRRLIAIEEAAARWCWPAQVAAAGNSPSLLKRIRSVRPYQLKDKLWRAAAWPRGVVRAMLRGCRSSRSSNVS